jgi:hypothetical protein
MYIIIYPLNKELIKEIDNNLIGKRKRGRKREINQIRVSNLDYAIYSNAGAILALFLAIFSILFTFFYAFQDSIENKFMILLKFSTVKVSISENGTYVAPLLVFLASYIILLIAAPYLIRRIIRNLTPLQYAEISLNNIEQSEMLSFVAFKLYDLCLKYEKKRDLDSLNQALNNFKSPGYSHQDLVIALNSNSFEIYNQLKNVKRNIKDFRKEFYNDYYKLVEIRKLASENLKLHPREFSHHILQFSPVLFHDQLATLFLSVDTLLYLTEGNNFAGRSQLIYQHLQEIYSIDENIAKGKRAVSQILLYEHTHKYLIGISSVTSTSRALSIFCRAISTILDRGYKNQSRKEIDTDEVLHNQVIGEFKTILYRSKAHYGFDLLLTVENLYKQYDCSKEMKSVPSVLYNLRYSGHGVPGIEHQPEANVPFKELLTKNISEIKNIRAFLVEQLEIEREAIKKEFPKKIKPYLEKTGRKVIIIFGYSRMVRLALRLISYHLAKDNILIFIMREDRLQMIDTRTFRYELSNAYSNRVRNTFTASDDFFRSLIRPDDHFLFLCGAEAYCPTRNLLMHTNTYQKRVEALLTYLEKMKFPKKKNAWQKKKPLQVDRQLWILAEKYKVYNDFPPEGYLFRKEMFSDHYDDVDLYNFTRFINKGLTVVHLPTHTDGI